MRKNMAGVSRTRKPVRRKGRRGQRRGGIVKALGDSVARLVAMMRAFALIAVAIYKLWALVRSLPRASAKRKDKLMDSLRQNLRALRITTNVDDLDVAIAYAAAVPYIVSRSPHPLTARVVAKAGELRDVLMAIRESILYAQRGERP